MYRVILERGKTDPLALQWDLAGQSTPISQEFWFVIKNKILTRDVLERRHICCDVNCSMCRDQKVTCLFSCQCAVVSVELHAKFHQKKDTGTKIGTGYVVTGYPDQLWREGKQKGNMPKGKLLNHVLCTCWWIWSQQNEGRSIGGKDSTRGSTMV